MRDLLNSFFLIKDILKKDQKILLLALVPIIMGIVIYLLLGGWIYGEVLGAGTDWMESYLGEDLGGAIRYVLVSLISILMYFMVSWTFVLIVSLLAAPLNDIVSTRVENALGEHKRDANNESSNKMIKRLFKIISNEIKKIIFIIILGFIAFALGFIPILSPISIVISCLLMAVNFIDYSWSRHQMSFSECFGHLKASFFVYSISGGLFMVLLSIPVVNLFALPVAVIYFTILFVKRSET